MKKNIPLLIFLFSTFLLPANEFWLQPDKFLYKWNEPINIRFLVGENFEGENWSGDRTQVNKLEIYFDGVKDDLADVLSDEDGDSLQLKLLDEGTAMVIFNSNNSYIELVAADFNAYLLEEGQTDILELRKRNNEMDSTGREFYQRSVKTIFQVGNRYNNTFKQETSLPVDMIPQQNPYSLKDGDSLEVKILFQKEPLTNHFIRLWQKKNIFSAKFSLLTDENGMIKFPVATEGIWMISTVKMERVTNDENAEPSVTRWQSYKGSCTWGYE